MHAEQQPRLPRLGVLPAGSRGGETQQPLTRGESGVSDFAEPSLLHPPASGRGSTGESPCASHSVEDEHAVARLAFTYFPAGPMGRPPSEASLWGSLRAPALLPPDVDSLLAASAAASAESEASRQGLLGACGCANGEAVWEGGVGEASFGGISCETFLDDVLLGEFVQLLQQRAQVCSALESGLADLREEQQEARRLLRQGSQLHSALSCFACCPEKFSAIAARTNLRFFPKYRVVPSLAAAAGLCPLSHYGDCSANVAAASAAHACRVLASPQSFGDAVKGEALLPADGTRGEETGDGEEGDFHEGFVSQTKETQQQQRLLPPSGFATVGRGLSLLSSSGEVPLEGVSAEGEDGGGEAASGGGVSGLSWMELSYLPFTPQVAHASLASVAETIEASKELLNKTAPEALRMAANATSSAPSPSLQSPPQLAACEDPWISQQLQQAQLVLLSVLPAKPRAGKDRKLKDVVSAAGRAVLALCSCSLEFKTSELRQQLAAGVANLQLTLAAFREVTTLERSILPVVYATPQHCLAALMLRGGASNPLPATACQRQRADGGAAGSFGASPLTGAASLPSPQLLPLPRGVQDWRVCLAHFSDFVGVASPSQTHGNGASSLRWGMNGRAVADGGRAAQGAAGVLRRGTSSAGDASSAKRDSEHSAASQEGRVGGASSFGVGGRGLGSRGFSSIRNLQSASEEGRCNNNNIRGLSNERTLTQATRGGALATATLGNRRRRSSTDELLPQTARMEPQPLPSRSCRSSFGSDVFRELRRQLRLRRDSLMSASSEDSVELLRKAWMHQQELQQRVLPPSAGTAASSAGMGCSSSSTGFAAATLTLAESGLVAGAAVEHSRLPSLKSEEPADPGRAFWLSELSCSPHSRVGGGSAANNFAATSSSASAAEDSQQLLRAAQTSVERVRASQQAAAPPPPRQTDASTQQQQQPHLLQCQPQQQQPHLLQCQQQQPDPQQLRILERAAEAGSGAPSLFVGSGSSPASSDFQHALLNTAPGAAAAAGTGGGGGAAKSRSAAVGSSQLSLLEDGGDALGSSSDFAASEVPLGEGGGALAEAAAVAVADRRQRHLLLEQLQLQLERMQRHQQQLAHHQQQLPAEHEEEDADFAQSPEPSGVSGTGVGEEVSFGVFPSVGNAEALSRGSSSSGTQAAVVGAQQGVSAASPSGTATLAGILNPSKLSTNNNSGGFLLPVAAGSASSAGGFQHQTALGGGCCPSPTASEASQFSAVAAGGFPSSCPSAGSGGANSLSAAAAAVYLPLIDELLLQVERQQLPLPSKIPGVCFNPSDNTWSAQWTLPTTGVAGSCAAVGGGTGQAGGRGGRGERKRKKRTFSVNMYGHEAARRLAVACRLQAEKLQLQLQHPSAGTGGTSAAPTDFNKTPSSRGGTSSSFSSAPHVSNLAAAVLAASASIEVCRP